MTKINLALKEIEHGHDLSVQDTQNLFDSIFKGEVSQEQIGALLMGLRNKGESIHEIQGAVLSMRGNMRPITVPDGAVDIVGTGGDGHGTLNVSTAAALVAAGAGVIVAKHGNRAASSLSGSSDVLGQLGVNLQPSWEVLERAAHEIGIVFLFAPIHHPSMKNVAEVRKKLGVRTIFNLLGPMTNPANVKHHVIGVFHYAWARPMAETLKALGSRTAWITYGHSGLDEISITGETLITQLKNNILTELTMSPEEVHLKPATLDAIKGGDASTNAQAIFALLDGKKNAYRDIVVMNAAAAIYVADKTNSYASAITLATKSIDSGAAKDKLAQLIRLTNEE
ncbi:MAG: anthranilate phosphoribosyltransferase [Alphaproteobacteria bacterium]|nr:anthranilate phosphoribosyltransferase [Alphaproteobacteria bacterium]